MADSASISPTMDLPAFMHLKILSPSSEIDGELSFAALSTRTTVGELKERIRDAIATRPPADRMRLIYRGRVVSRDEDTLIDVFGRDALQQSSSQTLHLVLREHHAHPSGLAAAIPTSRPSTVPPPNPFRTSSATPSVQPPPASTNPFRSSSARPQSQPQTPNPFPRPPAPPPFGIGPFHPTPHPPFPSLPPEINNLLNQGFAAAQAASTNGFNPQGPFPAGSPPDAASENADENREAARSRAHPHGQPRRSSVTMTLRSEAMFPVNATSGRHTPSSGSSSDTTGNATEGSSGSPSQAQPATQPSTGQPGPNEFRSYTREVTGPNGERWTVTVNNGPIAGPMASPIPPLLFPHFPGFQAGIPRAGNPTMRVPTPSNPVSNPSVQLASTSPPASGGIEGIQANLRLALRELDNIRNLVQVTQGELLSPSLAPQLQHQHSHARNHTESLLRHLDVVQAGVDGLSPTQTEERHSDIRELQALTNELRNLAAGLARSIDDLRNQSSPSASAGATTTANASRQPMAQANHTTHSSATNPETPQVYLLSGPNGPYALLMSPSGTYTTDPMVPRYPSGLTVSNIPAAGASLAFSTHPQISQATSTGQQVPQAPPAAPAVQQQALGVQLRIGGRGRRDNVAANQQGANNAAQAQGPEDALAVLGPIFGHIWWVVRILGIIYLITGGSGWRRALLLGGVAAFIYLAQMGVFNDLRHWQEFQQRLDNWLRPPEQQRNEANQQGAQEGQPRAQGQPDPAQAAQRLIAQQEQRNRAWFTEVERVLAVFMASLWPGFGEWQQRREAARREAEAAERRAQAEREQREREERESASQNDDGQQQQQVEAGSRDTLGEKSSIPASTVTGGANAPGSSSSAESNGAERDGLRQRDGRVDAEQAITDLD